MDYKKMGSRVYIRMDKGDEILSCIYGVCCELDIGFIGQQFDPVTGSDVWKLEGKA